VLAFKLFMLLPYSPAKCGQAFRILQLGSLAKEKMLKVFCLRLVNPLLTTDIWKVGGN